MIYVGSTNRTSEDSNRYRPSGPRPKSGGGSGGSIMDVAMLVMFVAFMFIFYLAVFGPPSDRYLSVNAISVVNRISSQYETGDPVRGEDMDQLQQAMAGYDRSEELHQKADALRHFLAIYHTARETPGAAIQTMSDTAWKTDQILRQGLPSEEEMREEERAGCQDPEWKTHGGSRC